MARARGIKQPNPNRLLRNAPGVSPLTAVSVSSASTGVKISELPAASAAVATDQFEVNQGGVSKRLTLEQLHGASDVDISAKSITLAPSTEDDSNLDQAINTEQWLDGTASGATHANLFLINGDTVAAGANFVNGWTFQHNFGGGDTSGGREPLAAYGFLVEPTSAASANRNYCALTGAMVALSSDNGSAATYGGSAGALFAAGLAVTASNGATNLNNVTACEFNTAMQTGSSAYAKSLAQFCSRSDDAVHGSGVDAMLWLFRQFGGATWTNGILFDYPGDPAGFPFTSASTVLKTGVGTIGTGIDFSSSTVSTAAFTSPGFSVSGTGVVSALTYGFGSDVVLKEAIGGFTGIANPVDGVVGIHVGQAESHHRNTAHFFEDISGGVSFSSFTSSAATFFVPLIGSTAAFNGNITALSTTAIAAGSSAQAFIRASSSVNLAIYYGTGDPSFSATKGSLYTRTDATTTTTRLWVNTNGSTTWANFTASA